MVISVRWAKISYTDLNQWSTQTSVSDFYKSICSQTLVRFFYANGEGLLLEDLKSGDYKVLIVSLASY